VQGPPAAVVPQMAGPQPEPRRDFDEVARGGPAIEGGPRALGRLAGWTQIYVDLTQQGQTRLPGKPGVQIGSGCVEFSGTSTTGARSSMGGFRAWVR